MKSDFPYGDLTPDEQFELEILSQAVADCGTAYRADPSAARKKDWDAAKAGLRDAEARLMEKYEACTNVDAPFPSVIAMVKALAGQGYKLKKSKAYKDKDKGILRVQPDGSVHQVDAAAYAKTLKRVAAKDPSRFDDYHEQKIKAEIRNQNAAAATREFALEKERGKYMLRSDLFLELAARAAVLDVGLRSRVRMKAAELTALVGGDPRKADRIPEWWDAVLDGIMTEFASVDRYQVIFMGEENE